MESILSELRLTTASCVIRSSPRRGRWCSRIAAAARWRRRTRSRRSTTASRSAPTASSSTSTCRATASSSSTTIGLLDRTTTLRGPDRRRATRGRAASAPDVPALADVLARYRDARDHRRDEGEPPGARARPSSTSSAAPARSIASASDRSAGACCARRARIEPAIATSAAREEVRWALYRSWCRWPVSRRSPTAAIRCRRRRHGRASCRRDSSRRAPRRPGVQVGRSNEEDARRLLEWGVDALITDRPV